MNLGIVATIAYGLLAVVGGIIGYAQARSTASLISGGISGLLLLLSGFLQLQGSAGGWWLGVLATGALLVVFGIRLAKTQKLMPAGLMLVAGTIALAALLLQSPL